MSRSAIGFGDSLLRRRRFEILFLWIFSCAHYFHLFRLNWYLVYCITFYSVLACSLVPAETTVVVIISAPPVLHGPPARIFKKKTAASPRFIQQKQTAALFGSKRRVKQRRQRLFLIYSCSGSKWEQKWAYSKRNIHRINISTVLKGNSKPRQNTKICRQ